MAKLGSKEKDKALQDVLKAFFRSQKSVPNATPWNKRENFVLTPEIIKEIGAETTIVNRLKAIQNLGETVLAKRIEENAVEAIWKALYDLLEPTTAKDYRHSALVFLRFLVHGQYEQLGVTRAVIFQYINEKNNMSEDLGLKFEILKALTDNGKDVKYFEERMGLILCSWMKDMLRLNANDFLQLLTNLIKFNSSLLDEDILVFIIKYTCAQICSTRYHNEVTNCISLLDVCVRYSSLPTDSLEFVVFAICRSVNVEEFCISSWQVMAHILGTHLGQRTIGILCNTLKTDGLIHDSNVLRGAVFVIGMGLWGSSTHTSIPYPPITVIVCFKMALRGKNVLVAREIGLALQNLVRKCGNKMCKPTWDQLFNVTEEIMDIFKSSNILTWTSSVADVIKLIEGLYDSHDYTGSPDRLHYNIENFSAHMPEVSVFRLLQYRSHSLNPHNPNWLTLLNQFVDKFYRQEYRINIRTKTLTFLKAAVEDARPTYEEDIIDKIILPLFKHIELENNAQVSQAAVEFLVFLARVCTSKFYTDVIQLIEKVLNKSLEKKEQKLMENDPSIQSAVFGLIDAFQVKVFQMPSTCTIRIFHVLINYLQTSYNLERVRFPSTVRCKILDFILSLRCNSFFQIGVIVEGDTKPTFSHFFICASSNKANSPNPLSPTPHSLQSPLVLPVDNAFQALDLCLQKDGDWTVLRMVLERLPTFLHNRALLLSGDGVIAQLCTTLCNMMEGRMQSLDNLDNLPLTFTRSDFHSFVLPVLASLVTYHKQLSGASQRRLVRCLEFGLVSKCARSCITALTLCTLEMHTTMYKVLPGVLLSLSKISATTGISIAILEFLSSLIRLPSLYASFVEDQYMSIFAIALPYVNPFKFNHNTVALAYHVIAMWFLKCRLPFRRDFVKFIIKGLQSNVLKPLEEGDSKSFSSSQHHVEDQTERRRAMSVNDQAILRKRDRAILTSGSSLASSETRPVLNPDRDLNVELTETCIDLMTRYAFAAYGAVPKRFSASEFLLTGGQSLTWLVGTKLVTVTTSGCSSKVTRNGLCEKCFDLCKNERDSSEGPQSSRRRHRSAIQPSVKSEMTISPPRTKDDLQLQRTASMDAAAHGDLNLRPTELDTRNLDRLLLTGLRESVETPPSLRPHLCNCWCQGWAEILVRRPTGNVSWMMRIQNSPHPLVTASDFPLADITTLFLPTREKTPSESFEVVTEHRRINSETLEEKEYEKIFKRHFDEGSSDSSLTTDVCETTNEQICANMKRDVTKMLETQVAATLKKESLRRTNSSPDLTCDCDPDGSRKLRVLSDAAHTAQVARQRVLSIIKSKPKSATASTDIAEEKPVKPKVSLRRNLSHREDGSTLPRRGSERSVHFDRKSIHSLPPSPSPLMPRSTDASTNPFRDRVHTISVANPAYRKNEANFDKTEKDLYRSGTNPSFVFLQLYHDSAFGKEKEKPMLLPKTAVYERALNCFDRIPPYETHKIGVVYVGKTQTSNEAAILGNEWGSRRYTEFLTGLGELIRLKEVDPQTTYIGGLATTGEDGKFAYIWQDDVMQVIFHVATLMPNKESDLLCVSKKCHIGNDFVYIVYNDSEEEYNINTMKGQFNYACVVVQPLDDETNLVVVKTKSDVGDVIGHSAPKIISNENLPILARQLALHANLASMIFQSQTIKTCNPYASNWLERLRDLKRLRSKLLDERTKAESEDVASAKSFSRAKCDNVQDFTDFV